jgi:hypothetical protein
MTILIENTPDDVCYNCLRKYKHRKIFRYVEDGLKETEFITSCCSCRSLFRKKNELQEQLLEIDFKIFERQYSNYLENNIKICS